MPASSEAATRLALAETLIIQETRDYLIAVSEPLTSTFPIDLR